MFDEPRQLLPQGADGIWDRMTQCDLSGGGHLDLVSLGSYTAGGVS